jgi:hypothetical protein
MTDTFARCMRMSIWHARLPRNKCQEQNEAITYCISFDKSSSPVPQHLGQSTLADTSEVSRVGTLTPAPHDSCEVMLDSNALPETMVTSAKTLSWHHSLALFLSLRPPPVVIVTSTSTSFRCKAAEVVRTMERSHHLMDSGIHDTAPVPADSIRPGGERRREFSPYC